MIATAEPGADTATRTVQPDAPAPPEQAEPKPATPEQTAELVVGRLTAFVLQGKPRAAIRAFRALTTLCKFYRETFARITELSGSSRPAVAAAAVNALVQARLAYRRYRDGRSPLLHR
jgi:hypothetical protein